MGEQLASGRPAVEPVRHLLVAPHHLLAQRGLDPGVGDRRGDAAQHDAARLHESDADDQQEAGSHRAAAHLTVLESGHDHAVGDPTQRPRRCHRGHREDGGATHRDEERTRVQAHHRPDRPQAMAEVAAHGARSAKSRTFKARALQRAKIVVLPRSARRGDPLVIAGCLIAAALRVVAVIGVHSYRYVDSIDYETLDFTGRARRPWITPLLYSLTDDDALRIVLQAVVGGAAWSVLAVQVAALIRDRRMSLLAAGAVLALGLTTSITNWDTAILSESMALSMTALLLAALLNLARTRDMLSAAYVVIASVLWVFTRQNHVVLMGLGVATAVGAVVVSRWRSGAFDRPLAVAAAGLVAVAALAGVSYSRNTEIVHFNLAMVIGQRVITDADALNWFLDHDMPLPDVVTPGIALFPEPLLADREFADWVADHGNATYVRYLLTHPWSTLTTPLEDFVADRPSYADPPRVDETMLSTAEAYGSARQVVPEPLEDLLFDPGGTGTVLLTLIAVLALTALRWHGHGWDGRWTVPLLTIGLQWPALTIVWHASTAELGRLALISAVALRVGVLVQLALLADAWLTDRHEAPHDGEDDDDDDDDDDGDGDGEDQYTSAVSE